jgi:sec-independent protein translocase protein TatA
LQTRHVPALDLKLLASIPAFRHVVGSGLWRRYIASLGPARISRHRGAAISPLGGFMGSFSIWHWMVVLLVVLLLFGGGKVSSLMGDFAKGIKSFKKNMAEGDDASMEASADKPTGSISGPAGEAAPRQRETTAAH